MSEGKVHQSGVQSAMLYGSETSQNDKEVVILRRTKIVMLRAMSGVKWIDRENANK